MSDEEKDDPIANSLNLQPYTETLNSLETLKAKALDDSARNDFEIARANIYEVIDSGKEALLKLSMVADSSQHPRAYEVLAKLMETIIDANKDLLDLQTKIRDINTADTPLNEKAKTINNNLFVGSTAELQKVLKELKNKDD
jgi:predicted transcriptional regulator